ncbi:Pyridoxamine 5'-phosphate oxidase family protein [Desulfosarcina cetonica]|nr:Pyridoxamine 5'-phosphate oxidase family protein [Desulfosarcina cetonica]
MTDKRDLQARAKQLINSEYTMALASSGENGPWVAPVYYVFYQGAMYFFSKQNSRHISESLKAGNAAATIYPFVCSWQEIKGVQMIGRVRSAGIGFTAIQAVRAYNAKFRFTKEFFEPGEALDLEAFVKRFRVKLYSFNPDKIFFLDNQIRFGFREEVIF